LLLVPLPITDSNNDGLPDHLDPGVNFIAEPAPQDDGVNIEPEPEPAPLAPEPADVDLSDRGEDPFDDGVATPDGFIETGLNGGVGCSIYSAANAEQTDAGLLAMLILVIGGGLRRLMRQRPEQRSVA